MIRSLWDEGEAARLEGDLAARVYSSRLLGREPSLVLHGGGNTSVKIRECNVLNREEEILYVKGSGRDLATMEESGFTPIRMSHLLELARLPRLSDLEMVNELRTHQSVASAPVASVEAILHAVLPYRYVDHTHADAVLTLTNTPQGELRIREIYGDDVLVIPYCMPGFDLARLVAERLCGVELEGRVGMILMNHGVFSFGDSARSSYERMIDLVRRAETYLEGHGARELPRPAAADDGCAELRHTLAALRRELSAATGSAV